MIIRVRGKDGNWRFDLNENDKVLQLKSKIQEVSNVSVPSLILSRNPNATVDEFANNQATLASLGLRHGDLLYVTYSGGAVSRQDIINQQKAEREANMTEDEREQQRKLRDIKMQWRLDEYLSHVEANSIRLKHQEKANCASAALDSSACNLFQSFLREMAFQVQRMGYLYGRLTEVEGENGEKSQGVIVDAIYEPPQEGTHEGCIELNDPRHDRVDAIATMLGLVRVGWIFSHARREYIMSGAEIIKTAEYQAKYGKHFVTVTVSVNEENQAQFEAYQVSDQCVEMYDKKWLQTSNENAHHVRSKKPVIMEHKEHTEIDATVLITTVAIKEAKGLFITGFPSANRDVMFTDFQPSMRALKNCLQNRSKAKFVERISDFQLLCFLTDYLSLTSDMPTICEAVRTKNDNMALPFQHLIFAYCGLE